MIHITSISMTENESIQYPERALELHRNFDNLAGWVDQSMKPWAVADISVDVRHFKISDQADGFVTRCHLSVSIFHKGETLGVLEAVNNTDSVHYTEEDTTILETLASQEAVAIRKTILIERVQKSMDEMARLDRMNADFIAFASHEPCAPLRSHHPVTLPSCASHYRRAHVSTRYQRSQHHAIEGNRGQHGKY